MSEMLAHASEWPAPAKINLFLHVTGRRRDGYHNIQTIFQFLDFGDTVAINVTGDGDIHRFNEHPEIPESEDLAIRAAHLLKKHSGSLMGAEISVRKHIPIGSGLGGGSSNAATVLLVLNQLWALHLSHKVLARIGLELGADVPVFIHGHSAWAEGIGEKLTPLEPHESWYLIVVPDCQVSSRTAYEASELQRNCEVLQPQVTHDRMRNVFEPVVRYRYPEITQAMNWLEDVTGEAHLSGSGAAVFAPFATRAAAEVVRQKVPAHWFSVVARGHNVSPLTQRLNEEA